MEKVRKPPSFKPFDAGNNKPQPPGVHGRNAPLSKPKLMPDPRETAQSTVQQVTAKADLTPAEEAKLDKPLPPTAKTAPSKAAKGDDDLMSVPPQKP